MDTTIAPRTGKATTTAYYTLAMSAWTLAKVADLDCNAYICSYIRLF